VFRTLARLCLPNPLDRICKRALHKGQKKFLLAWNRGLGDIALGLYAIVHRIREKLPDADITFLIRENLQEGFSLLEGVNVMVASGWKRGEPYDVNQTLLSMGRSPGEFDVIIPWPNPTEWVPWQRGTLVPKLAWKKEYNELYRKFDLPDGLHYIAAQVSAETHYGLWRNWPLKRWQELFEELEGRKETRVILFGFGDVPRFESKQVIDLRGQTTLFELLSIIVNRCRTLIAPDSGILSMAYYLDVAFPLRVISLWADRNHGILKQNVPSPNPLLLHRPLFGERRDLSTVSAKNVLQVIHAE
jgi:ADP-heptose:LPS heptosyltransferase